MKDNIFWKLMAGVYLVFFIVGLGHNIFNGLPIHEKLIYLTTSAVFYGVSLLVEMLEMQRQIKLSTQVQNSDLTAETK